MRNGGDDLLIQVKRVEIQLTILTSDWILYRAGVTA